MRDKRNLNLEKIFWQIKGMRHFFIIPFLIIFLVQPVYMYLILKAGYGFAQPYITDEIITEILQLYPPLSLWWAFWVLKKYLEDDDRELYYLYEKNKWHEIFAYNKLYMGTILLSMLFYSPITGIKLSFYYYICIASVCFFYTAFTYWLAYFIKSVTIILLPVLLYTFWVVAPYNYSVYNWSYVRLFNDNFFKGIVHSLIFVMAGIVFVYLGKRENHKYINYS